MAKIETPIPARSVMFTKEKASDDPVQQQLKEYLIDNPEYKVILSSHTKDGNGKEWLYVTFSHDIQTEAKSEG